MNETDGGEKTMPFEKYLGIMTEDFAATTLIAGNMVIEKHLHEQAFDFWFPDVKIVSENEIHLVWKDLNCCIVIKGGVPFVETYIKNKVYKLSTQFAVNRVYNHFKENKGT